MNGYLSLKLFSASSPAIIEALAILNDRRADDRPGKPESSASDGLPAESLGTSLNSPYRCNLIEASFYIASFFNPNGLSDLGKLVKRLLVKVQLGQNGRDCFWNGRGHRWSRLIAEFVKVLNFDAIDADHRR